MIRMFASFSLLGVLCFAALAQSKDQQPAGAEQAVMRIEREMLSAGLKGDASASERHLAAGFVFTGPDGTRETKAQVVADLKTGDLKLQSASLDGPKVQIYGDTAVVTYESHDKGTYKGKDITGVTRWTDVFVKQDGRWQMVASHGSMTGK